MYSYFFHGMKHKGEKQKAWKVYNINKIAEDPQSQDENKCQIKT